MSDLIDDVWKEFLSHPDKQLTIHTQGVLGRTEARSSLVIASIAAKLHDVGKVNPNFQRKIRGVKLEPREYSSHAYLSAITFLRMNDWKKIGIKSQQRFSIAMIVAKHHGSLNNFSKGKYCSSKTASEVKICLKEALSEDEYKSASQFLKSESQTPFDEFGLYMLQINSSFCLPPLHDELPIMLLKPEDSLKFFLETQFAFASLIESDKRDASNNKMERRKEDILRLTTVLTRKLGEPFPESKTKPSASQIELNLVRTAIQAEAIENIKKELVIGDSRIFTLASPTGSGKTRTLLAIASAILNYRNRANAEGSPELQGIIYALPFLSITEQVEKICRGLLSDKPDGEDSMADDPKERSLLLRADSAANNSDIEKLMGIENKSSEDTDKLLKEDYAELTFDSPLVITTFVQFFETLMSNRNATLLKLPNFARSVILIDEYQALPPRLYTFFAAYLEVFCRMFDSYVIFSTATMPHLKLPEKEDTALTPSVYFPEYKEPAPLVSAEHFKSPSFSRYTIEPRWEVNSLEGLAGEVCREAEVSKQVMVVLNTINDTRELFKLLTGKSEESGGLSVEIDGVTVALSDENVVLLNTRFIPEDRRAKIQRVKDTGEKKPLILITTQLIEAGVDIDFPVVFRDNCPLPNLIQAAGRCNRNNKNTQIKGRIILVDIQCEKGKSRGELIYTQDIDNWYLDFTKERILAPIDEEELLEVQSEFFIEINKNLRIGSHPNLGYHSQYPKNKVSSNLLLCIRDAAFEDAGNFRLIDETGEQYSFYVTENDQDVSFDTLKGLADKLFIVKRESKGNFEKVKIAQIKLESHLRKMRNRVVQARMKEEVARLYDPSLDSLMGIYLLKNRDYYTAEFGLEMKDDRNFC